MSTFNGRLQDPLFNFIAIDEFSSRNHDATFFFVSHAHSDHLKGLECYGETLFGRNSNKTLYCSSITKRLLQIKYSNIPADSFKSLDIGDVKILESSQENKCRNSPSVTVTVLPASHILGSVMFLFQCQNITALYTGDFRIYNAEDISKIEWLHDEDGRPLRITDLYLDTTFADEDYIWFPMRDYAPSKIIELSKQHLNGSVINYVSLTLPSYYGYENLIINVSRGLNRKILVNEGDFAHFKCIPKMNECVVFYNKFSPEDNKQHIIDSNRIHVCINRPFICSNELLLCDICYNSNSGKYKLRVLMPRAKSFKLDLDDHAKSLRADTFSNFSIAHSLHCSLTELRCFTNYLRPTNIHPLVTKGPEETTLIRALLLDNHKKNTSD